MREEELNMVQPDAISEEYQAQIAIDQAMIQQLRSMQIKRINSSCNGPKDVLYLDPAYAYYFDQKQEEFSRLRYAINQAKKGEAPGRIPDFLSIENEQNLTRLMVQPDPPRVTDGNMSVEELTRIYENETKRNNSLRTQLYPLV